MTWRSIQVVMVRLAALALLVATAVVAVETKIGPVVVVLWTGRGFHGLDAVLIVISVPLAVVLLRYAERLREDDEDTAHGDRSWTRRR